MAREKARLTLRKLLESALKGVGNSCVKRATLLAQKRAVCRILD
jgi:hypothetical protein